MKEIEIVLERMQIHPGDEIHGTIQVHYTGRYDGVMVNTQILDSNELITYLSYNKKTISQKTARLFIGRDLMPDGRVELTASIGFNPKREHDVKFRASIIEQHKEIASDIVFGRFSV